MDNTALLTDYSGRDLTAGLERALTRLRSDCPELTDLNPTDPGVAILRNTERDVDLLNLYLDLAFAESFVRTAKFKQSIIELAYLVGVQPKLASAAMTLLRITRVTQSGGTGNDIIIPKYTPFQRSDGLVYLTMDSVFIPASSDYVDVAAWQGELVTKTVTPDDLEIVDLSGYPKFNLGSNVAARSVIITHQDGSTAWTEVDSFWRSTPEDRHFNLELYADEWDGETDTVFAVFGNGIKGRTVPVEGVTISFLRTAGSLGNSGTNTITTTVGAFAGIVTVSNIELASGGAGAEGTESLRERMPGAVQIQQAAVTKLNYENLLKRIPGVAQCQCVDRNDSSQWPHLHVSLYVLPEGGGLMSTPLKEIILGELREWGHLGNWDNRYILLEAISVPINVTCRVNVADGYVASTVQNNVYQTILGLFPLDNIKINGKFDFTDLNVTASRVAGVNWIEFDDPKADVVLGIGEYPIPGTITVNVVS
jgi:hypothetical protein